MGRSPIVLGVTGGIGAGKSSAVDAFVREGARSFSADAAVHELYETSDVCDALRSHWGDDVFDDAGNVDRSVVARIVFADAEERRWLEQLLHPLVARSWLRWLDEVQRSDPMPEFVVAEVPLLFEAGLDDRYDATVLITAPLQERLRRVGDRAGGPADAAGRAAVQLSDEQKADRADFVYANTGSIDGLATFVRRVMDDMRMRAIPAGR